MKFTFLHFRWYWLGCAILALLFLFLTLHTPAASKGGNDYPALDPDFPGTGVAMIPTIPTAPFELVEVNNDKLFTFGNGATMLQLLPGGLLDPNFGNNGLLSVSFGNDTFLPRSAVVDNNGYIIVAGTLYQSIPNPNQAFLDDAFVMIRLTPNGILDTTFGIEGLARIPLDTNPSGQPLRLLRQADGKFIVLYADEFQAYPPRLYRLQSDATLDSTFGINGSISVQMDRAKDIAIQPDGVIVLGGNNDMSEANIARVQRYSVTDGTLDPVFGESGTRAIAFTESAGISIHKLKATYDSKIALVTTLVAPEQPDLLAVTKLTTDGDIDSTFNQDGIAIITPPSTFLNTNAGDMILTPEGIAIVGAAEFIQPHRFSVVVVKLAPNGEVDSSFGTDGFYYEDYIAHLNDGSTIIAKPDGEFLIGGTRFGLAVLNLKPNGTPDYTYGPQGYYMLGNTNSIAVEKIVPQNDGRLLIYSPLLGGTFVFRAFADGTRDTTYGTQGVSRILAPGQGNTGPSAVGATVDRMNRLILVGFTEIFGDTPVLSRVTENGDLDSTFGEAGYLFFGTPDREQAHDVAIDHNDKFIVVGRLQNSSLPDDLVIRRLLDTGTPDLTFGNNGVVTIPNCPAISPSYVDLAAQSHLAILDDGDLLISAYCNRGSTSVTLLIRLNTNGTFDSDYGNNGLIVVSIPFVDWYVSPEGETTLLHDYFYSSNDSWIVSRYRMNGLPDTSFGNNGQVIHPIPDIESLFPKAIARQSNGNYVLLGSEFLGEFSNFDMRLARLLPTGTLDNTFGNAGLALFDLDRLEIPGDLTINDNYAIVTGPISPRESLTFGVARFLLDTPILTPTPTPTLIPTSTLTPTGTPVPPTSTPSSTLIPTSTLTATATSISSTITPTATATSPTPQSRTLYLPLTQRGN